MAAVLALCAGFLLAVLWFDLMFDVQVLGRGRGADPLPEEVLASIAAYYRRVTTQARPMNYLVGRDAGHGGWHADRALPGRGVACASPAVARAVRDTDRRGEGAHGAERGPARLARRPARRAESAGARHLP